MAERAASASMRLAAFIGALIVVLAADPGRAAAHTELVRSDPPAEGLLVVPPRDLDLWFTEEVAGEGGSPSVRLLDPEGRELPVSGVRVDAEDGAHVVADLDALAPGTVTVAWSARSLVDGHTLSGTFAFRIGAGRAPGATTVEGDIPRAWAVVTRWLTFLGVAVAAAGFLFGPLVLRSHVSSPQETGRRALVTAVGAAAALTASLAEPLLQSRWPPAGSLAPTLGDALAGVPDAWWLRPAALLPCVALAAVAYKLRGGRFATVVAWAGFALALTALLGLSLTSHASARDDWRGLALGSNILHQWSIALWVGGLVHLGLWWSGRRSPGQESGDVDTVQGGPLRRFSRLALPLVLVGIGTGLANAGLVLPALRSLWTSDYGGVLLLKTTILTLPLALATFNRRALRRIASGLRPAIRQTVRVEAALVLLVVLGGSSLALLAPPAAKAELPPVADVPMPAFAAYDGRDILVHLRFTPGRAGQNGTTVSLSEYDRSLFAGEPPNAVRLRFANLELGGDGAPVDAKPETDGSWSVAGTHLSVDGWWRVEATIRWLGRSDVVVPFYLLLPDPNLNGLDAPSVDLPSDPAAAALYEAAMAAYTGVHRLRYAQSMASHQGSVSHGIHVVNDGADGSTPGFTYDAPGGWQYVVLGATSWSRRPGEPWTVRKANPMIPPARWDDEYLGATGFRFARIEEVNGEPSQLLHFVVPGTGKQVVAWYVWWIGTESGRLHREMMVSQSHYMLSDFSRFDEPLPIVPPAEAPPAAIPTP